METQAIAEKISDLYPLVSPTLHFQRHNENAVYRADCPDGTSFVIRLHASNPNLSHHTTPRRLDWLESEMTFVEALSACEGITVQTPLRTHEGALVARLPEDTGFATVLSWLPGAPLDPTVPDAAAHAQTAGALAARLHTFAADNSWLNALPRPHYGAARMRETTTLLKDGIDDGLFSVFDYAVLVKAGEAIGACMEEANATPGAYGLVHSDLGLGNLLLHNGTVSPIDFGLCGHSPFLFDLGGLMGAFNEPALRRAALDGYAKHRPLQAADTRCIEACFLAGIFLFMAMHLRNPHVREWFGRRLPAVTHEYIEPFLRGNGFLPLLLDDA